VSSKHQIQTHAANTQTCSLPCSRLGCKTMGAGAGATSADAVHVASSLCLPRYYVVCGGEVGRGAGGVMFGCAAFMGVTCGHVV
jgi:hypothetical protein